MRHKSQQLNTETEELREELKQQGNMNTAKIGSLSRYALTHPDRVYVWSAFLYSGISSTETAGLSAGKPNT